MDELARGLAGQPLVGKSKKNPEYWKRSWNNPAKCIGAPGSNNWDRISAGCRLAWELTAWGIEPIADIFEIIDVSRSKWGGKEMHSTTYEAFTGAADFAIQQIASQRGIGNLFQSILEHNRYRAALYLALWDPISKGGVAIGQRSAGWPFSPQPPTSDRGVHPNATWIDAVTQVGMGWAEPRIGWKDGGNNPKKVIWWAQAAVREAFSVFRTRDDAFAYLRDHPRKSIIPTFVLETSQGMAAWQSKMIHASTAAVLAYVRRGSLVDHAPIRRGAGPNGEHDPGRRSRHSGMSTLERRGDLLLYRNAKNYPDSNLLLPGGDVLRYVEIGGDAGYGNNLSRFTGDGIQAEDDRPMQQKLAELVGFGD